jgi:hypothetical protein
MEPLSSSKLQLCAGGTARTGTTSPRFLTVQQLKSAGTTAMPITNDISHFHCGSCLILNRNMEVLKKKKLDCTGTNRGLLREGERNSFPVWNKNNTGMKKERAVERGTWPHRGSHGGEIGAIVTKRGKNRKG